MTSRNRRLTLAIAAASATALIGVLLIPRPPTLSTAVAGDPAFVDEVRSLVAAQSGPRDRLSVILIDGDDERSAHFGATDDTVYEIGSMTKTFTAALFADAVERGEVETDTRIGDLLDLGAGEASDVTLEQLATHSSGLPRLPQSLDVTMRSVLSQLRASDPYTFDLDQLEGHARDSAVGANEYEYSNLGFALLGQALAAAAGTDYAELVGTRILDPIGMSASSVPTSADDLPDSPTTGFTATGRAADPWTMRAYAPAGSIRSSPADMTSYARALLAGDAPGSDALTPRADAGEVERIGYAWFTTDGVTWHNGMTGGFSSFVGLDRESERAVVVLSDTAVNLDALGMSLLGRDS